MDQPKTRQEKGKGKGAKTKDVFNQRTVRLKTAIAAAAAQKKATRGK
jgi:hypothetical protein